MPSVGLLPWWKQPDGFLVVDLRPLQLEPQHHSIVWHASEPVFCHQKFSVACRGSCLEVFLPSNLRIVHAFYWQWFDCVRCELVENVDDKVTGFSQFAVIDGDEMKVIFCVEIASLLNCERVDEQILHLMDSTKATLL